MITNLLNCKHVIGCVPLSEVSWVVKDTPAGISSVSVVACGTSTVTQVGPVPKTLVVGEEGKHVLLTSGLITVFIVLHSWVYSCSCFVAIRRHHLPVLFYYPTFSFIQVPSCHY